jgi:ribonuclease Z
MVGLVVLVGCGPSASPERDTDAASDSREGESAAAALDVAPSDLVLTFLGTGSPRPSELRYGPSILVEAGDTRLLIDSSWGLRERLLQVGSFDLITGLDHVLLTHLHFDHTVGLSDLWLTGWLYGRRVPLRVDGPAGTEAMVDALKASFDWDVEYRTVVGVPAAGSDIIATDVAPGVIYEQGDIRITAFTVEHMPIDIETRELLDFPGQTYGYLIDYGEHSAVFSGDTRPSANVVSQATGADVLVHEVQVPSPGASDEAQLANVSLSVHSTPSQVGAVFQASRPRLAVYSHIIPPETTARDLAAQTPYEGLMTVAHDLMMIIIGDDIRVTDRPSRSAERFEDSAVLR